jgi:lysine 2,3-aminomutase
MAKKNRLIRDTTKQPGRKTEEIIFWRSSKKDEKSEEEGISHTLPFLFSLHDLDTIPGLQPVIRSLNKAPISHNFRISRHYLDLIDFQDPYCPIRAQAIPSLKETVISGEDDPLGEARFSVTPILIRRHPDRCVFLVSSECAMYCRFCNRRRFAGKSVDPGPHIEESLSFIENDTDIREVILSGGDPLMLEAEKFHAILTRLRSMKKKLIIRLSTRLPVVHPEGITAGHLKAIKDAAPIWIIVHINHPKEITRQFLNKIESLHRCGASMVSQTVLLRNVNDCPHVLLELFASLVEAGIKPYYLFQLDDVSGASHFKVRLSRGREIMAFLYEHASGLAIPRYALDIPGGLGKIPVDPEHVQFLGKRTRVKLISPAGKTGYYNDDGEESVCMGCGRCGGTAKG